MKSFESWLFDDVEAAFQIERNYKSEKISEWIKSEYILNERQKETLEILNDVLLKNIDTWNEDELKMQFIGPLLALVNYNTSKYKVFTQRSLSIKTDTVETSGLVDFMLATGKSRPKEPFFFLHEYKQQHPSKNDPLGQLLIAMIVAQSKNTNPHPVYGVVVEGRYWYFVILSDKEYAVSRGFDASGTDIYHIYSILFKVKDYIEEILAK